MEYIHFKIFKIYKEILYELYNVKITREELIKIIKDFIEKYNIFFVLMGLNYYGIIIMLGP